jgi:hypothetical protein
MTLKAYLTYLTKLDESLRVKIVDDSQLASVKPPALASIIQNVTITRRWARNANRRILVQFEIAEVGSKIGSQDYLMRKELLLGDMLIVL